MSNTMTMERKVKTMARYRPPQSGDQGTSPACGHLWVRNPQSSGVLTFLRFCVFAFAAAALPAAALAQAPTVSEIWPTYSYTCGARPFRLFAENYQVPCAGMKVKLIKAGEPDIAAFHYHTWTDGSWIDGEFDIADGTAGGLWSAVLTNPDGQSATLTDAFEVIPECPKGRVGDLYVTNKEGTNGMRRWSDPCGGGGTDNPHYSLGNVLQFDAQTGRFVCVFAFGGGPGPDDWLIRPMDLTWGPNGNLFVVDKARIDPINGNVLEGNGKVIEYDGQTGEYVRTFISLAALDAVFPDLWTESLAFGGPNANLRVLKFDVAEPADQLILEFDRVSGGLVGAMRATGLEDTGVVRFGPSGNLLLGGRRISVGPTLGEYDPVSGDLLRWLLVESHSDRRRGFVWEPWTNTLLIGKNATLTGHIDRVDFANGGVLEVVVPEIDPYGPGTLRMPHDFSFGPNGNLYVTGNRTWSCLSVIPSYPQGVVHEYDPTSVPFQQLSVFGCAYDSEGDNGGPLEGQLSWPRGMEFKPLPGDYGGKTAGADWQVDLDDFGHFADAYSGPAAGVPYPASVNPALALLAFDRDRDGDIDLADYAAFQRSFGDSMQITGACCLPDGSCEKLWKLTCGVLGGLYQGDDVTCSTVACPPPGVCCLPDGSCEELPEFGCAAAGGDFQGEGTICTAGLCPPAGACCDGVQGFCTDLTDLACIAAGGAFQGEGTDCSTTGCPSCVPCPPGGVPEGEPLCEFPDTFNGGCNSAVTVFSPIACGMTVCGTVWAENDTRDTDWYELVLTEQNEVIFTVGAEFDLVAGFLETTNPGSPTCSNITGFLNPFDTAGTCGTATVSAVLDPGTYWLVLANVDFDGAACAAGPWDYTATVTCGPPDRAQSPESQPRPSDEPLPVIGTTRPTVDKAYEHERNLR